MTISCVCGVPAKTDFGPATAVTAPPVTLPGDILVTGDPPMWAAVPDAPGARLDWRPCGRVVNGAYVTAGG